MQKNNHPILTLLLSLSFSFSGCLFAPEEEAAESTSSSDSTSSSETLLEAIEGVSYLRVEMSDADCGDLIQGGIGDLMRYTENGYTYSQFSGIGACADVSDSGATFVSIGGQLNLTVSSTVDLIIYSYSSVGGSAYVDSFSDAGDGIILVQSIIDSTSVSYYFLIPLESYVENGDAIVAAAASALASM